MNRTQRVAHRYRYLLGDSRREAARLRAQARLWDPVAVALFDRLGVRRGSRVLEVGPGQAETWALVPRPAEWTHFIKINADYFKKQ